MKKLCKEYAKALYELASEHSLEDTISTQLRQVCTLLDDNPDYVRLLDNPAIEKKQRIKLASEAFADVQEYLKSFILLLTEARHTNELARCADCFQRIYDTKHGILRAEIITACGIDDTRAESIRTKLEAKTGKQVVLSQKIDPSLIGGVLLKYGTRQIDMSVKASLNSISEMIMNADI